MLESLKMSSFKIGERSIGRENDPIFVIAEVGQNHQGNMEMAMKLILQAKKCGCDCVKFQKSCLTAKFTKSALDRPYESADSWGRTYGEHKQHLEFSIEQYKELQDYCNSVGILFSASAMDEVSLQELMQLNLPFIKIGSGDANNFPLIESAAKSKVPLVISTGMQSMETIRRIVEIMKMNEKENFCLMHCVSAYPTKPEDSTLAIITLLKKEFPEVVVGYSGHEEGILISKVAALRGAKVIERHFTLDRKQKGTDHKLSLLPEEFQLLNKFLRELERNYPREELSAGDCISLLSALPSEEETIRIALKDVQTRRLLDCEKSCRRKLGKSLVYAKDLSKGHIIQKNDLAVKVSEPFGISAECLEKFVGACLRKNVYYDENLLESDFY